MIEGLTIGCLGHIPVVGFLEEKNKWHCYNLVRREEHQLLMAGHESTDTGRWSG